MAVNLVINGVAYSFPNTGDQTWGDNVTNWATAVTNNIIQKSGGNFVLTGDLNFGASFGLLSKYFTSVTVNPAVAGVVRLSKTDTINFRNNANTLDLPIGINASDQFTFGTAGAFLPLSGGTMTGKLGIAYTGVSLELTGGGGGAGELRYLNQAASGHYNWRTGAQLTSSDMFEVTPSTTVDGTTFSNPVLKLNRGYAQLSSVDGSSAAAIRLNYYSPTSGFYNWQVASGYAANNVFEITPSTIADGATFSSPAIRAYATDGHVTLGSDSNTSAHIINGALKSGAANPSLTGLHRLANADTINWRNNANSADLVLSPDANDRINWNGPGATLRKDWIGTTLLNVTNGLSNAGAQSLLRISSSIDDLNIFANSAGSASSGITSNALFTGGFSLSQLGINPINFKTNGTIALAIDGSQNVSLPLATASRALALDGSKNIVASATTAAQLGYLSTATSDVQVQLNTLSAASSNSYNYLYNGDFSIWQRNTTALDAGNGLSTYVCDRWFIKNALGTGGRITTSRVAGTVTGSVYAAKLQITTAPTAAQVNGCEFYQVLENADSIALYNQTASFSVQVKGLNNVTQVGIQFCYATTEIKPTVFIGAEVLTTVNSASFVSCAINGQALGASMTTAGVIGVRIRITTVSAGNTYDLNNGFIVEQANINLAAAIAPFKRKNPSLAQELNACQRYFEKTGDLANAPGSVGDTNGQETWFASFTGSGYPVKANFKATKRAIPTIPTFVIYSPATGASGSVRDISIGQDVSVASINGGQSGILLGWTFTSGHQYTWQWAADLDI